MDCKERPWPRVALPFELRLSSCVRPPGSVGARGPKFYVDLQPSEEPLRKLRSRVQVKMFRTFSNFLIAFRLFCLRQTKVALHSRVPMSSHCSKSRSTVIFVIFLFSLRKTIWPCACVCASSFCGFYGSREFNTGVPWM